MIEIDDVANMYATLPGSDPDAKRIVMASHVDSVKNGGNYDGILGVMSAMEVLETVHEKQIPHKHPLTAMIWTNEEGSLYPPAMMCSGIVCYDSAVTGTFFHHICQFLSRTLVPFPIAAILFPKRNRIVPYNSKEVVNPDYII